MFTRHSEREGGKGGEGGGKEGRRERGVRAICARGKQAESPVRGKFTLVWWGAGVEERQDWCYRGHSPETGAAVLERAAVCATFS